MTELPRPDETDAEMAALWLERLLRTSDKPHFVGLLEWLHYPEAQVLGGDDLRALDARIALYLAASGRPEARPEGSASIVAWLDAQLGAWRQALQGRLDVLLDEDTPARVSRLDAGWEHESGDPHRPRPRPHDLSDTPF